MNLVTEMSFSVGATSKNLVTEVSLDAVSRNLDTEVSLAV